VSPNSLLIQNSPAIKKVGGPKKAVVKKDVKSKVETKKCGCDKWQKFNNNNQDEIVLPPHVSNSPELWRVFLPLTYYHSHFLPPPWILHLFSQQSSYIYNWKKISLLLISVHCKAGKLLLLNVC